MQHAEHARATRNRHVDVLRFVFSAAPGKTAPTADCPLLLTSYSPCVLLMRECRQHPEKDAVC